MKGCKVIASALAALLALPLGAQESAALRLAMYLGGAATEEEADPSLVERLESRLGRPVRINSKRLDPELLSPYQRASIADYRRRSGDILSWEELSLVDGFGTEAVKALRPFLSLESSAAPGMADTLSRPATREVLLRTTLKNTGVKYRENGEWYRLGVSVRERDGTGYFEATAGRFRAVAGDYNLRFGQGLALWSGFSMESLASPDAFIRRQGGLSPAWSYSPGGLWRGVAAAWEGSGMNVSAFSDFREGKGGARAEVFTRHFQVGGLFLTGRQQPLRISADARGNWRGLDSALELAFQSGGGFAGKGALSFRPLEQFRLFFQARAIPSAYSGKKNGEYALAAGVRHTSSAWMLLAGKSGFGSSVPLFSASLTADAALLPRPDLDEPFRRQLRFWADAALQPTPLLSLDFRLNGRYRSYEAGRTGIRSDLSLASGPWNAKLRAEAAFCGSLPGLLGYLEAGYKDARAALWLRFTAFRIDDWAARIYCYERDAPGTFSVPAYNGRGLAASLYANLKWMWGPVRFTASLRAACKWRKDREAEPALGVQLQARIF
ncbi:MAG: hypothetical protein J6T89_03115 [Bacteroidales bacterium]|nr:hypothetical protein [Bacteroidales bacterium]